MYTYTTSGLLVFHTFEVGKLSFGKADWPTSEAYEPTASTWIHGEFVRTPGSWRMGVAPASSKVYMHAGKPHVFTHRFHSIHWVYLPTWEGRWSPLSSNVFAVTVCLLLITCLPLSQRLSSMHFMTYIWAWTSSSWLNTPVTFL